MRLTHRLHGLSKASFFGVTSAAVHGGLALAFPTLPPAAETAPTPTVVWLTAADTGTGAGEQERASSMAPASTPAPVAAHAPRRQHKVERVAHRVPTDEVSPAHARESTEEQHEPAIASNLSSEEGTSDVGPSAAAGNLSGLGSGAGAATGAAGDGTTGTGAGAGLAHGPGLIARGSPCHRYFPVNARADAGEVQIEVSVDEHGRAHASNVLVEMPKGHGFASAASACVAELRFDPALTQDGAQVAGRAKLRLRFRRS
ncbi:MAG: hypothetical protein QM778_16920 [Myxococcales bacterium]